MAEISGGGGGGGGDEGGSTAAEKDQQLLLPIANVGRIMKQMLPRNAKISKEAKETMQESVSEFIGFVTGEALDRCRQERRKTLNGDDIVSAMEMLGFDNYVDPLKRYLYVYREQEVAAAAGEALTEEDHHHRSPFYPGQQSTNPTAPDEAPPSHPAVFFFDSTLYGGEDSQG